MSNTPIVPGTYGFASITAGLPDRPDTKTQAERDAERERDKMPRADVERLFKTSELFDAAQGLGFPAAAGRILLSRGGFDAYWSRRAVDAWRARVKAVAKAL